MSNNKENRIFDFGETPIPHKSDEEGIVTYTVAENTFRTADEKHPILILDGKSKMPHHICGMFLNPDKRTAFSGEKDGTAYNADIIILDSRFVDFVHWLGENHVPLKLSCRPCQDGYAVYRMRATNLRGEIRTDSDAFLQFAITKLLNSWPQTEETVDDEDQDASDEGNIILNDMTGMSDFLACAGKVLPSDIRRWAKRNLMLAKTGNISAEEKMHAKRALSIMLNIEWQRTFFEPIDPEKARQILDEELYGMEKVKQRIIEIIIQINRTHTLPAYGILLAGPAGVGKSQLAYAVARILKLPWTGLDMSSIRDAEALTGSPRVYANAKPGLIMEAFMKAGCSNLVFIINELDKADSTKNNSNPADALLTLLDNLGYTDNYIECMIPTGGVYPIATANDKSKIGAPLLSRFAVIDIPDYSHEEKREIFRRFSLPKTLKRLGMQEHELIISDEALDVIISHTKGTTGCRSLEQAAEHLAANALYRIETEKLESVSFDAAQTQILLEG